MDDCDLHRKALHQCSVELHSKLNPDSIVPYLQRDNLLTDNEENILTDSSKYRKDKINSIISMLPTKGSGWWEKFIKALRNTTTGTAHNEVADKLEQQLAELSVDNDELQKNYDENVKIGSVSNNNNHELQDPQLMVLIQTVNENEFRAAMLQLKGYKATEYNVHDAMCDSYSYYYVGYWGNVKVAIVQTDMGAQGFSGSWYETRKALYLMPQIRYIFLVGVCGGRKGKVQLGDVVVSKEVHGFDELKMIPGRMINRGFKSLCKGRNFYRYISQTAHCPKQSVKLGVVLSGPWLVADDYMQQKLWDMSPDGVAVEMEGAGVIRAVDGKNLAECLVVKGVCDLADEHKDDNWQPQAATNAAEYLCEMMNNGHHLFEVRTPAQ
ncbi:death domain-containing ATP nucleosidase-like isoform X3 [Dysidea avara]|uniref:death domain-containing ATP nucleosidase-like isoform X3 n=1 Tax=Dysidea avara TaxID=196820 RepID=UPI00332C294C